MSHYYQFDETLRSKRRFIDLYINEEKLTFISDVGVFSNNKVDYGSFLLIKTLLKEPNCQSLLDMGCGYGVIGITLDYFKKCETLTMVDINKRAVDLTLENINKFELTNAKSYVSDGFKEIKDNYDVIAFNPPIRAGKKVIYPIYDDSVLHLNKDGRFYIVIHKDLGANSTINYLKEKDLNVDIILKDKGYFILKVTKI